MFKNELSTIALALAKTQQFKSCVGKSIRLKARQNKHQIEGCVLFMKRYGNLYVKIYDMENLRLAHKNARKDKSHYTEVQMVDSNIDYYLLQIQQMLINGTYEVSDYTYRKIIDKGKERELSKLPYFPDRIIQWAIMLQLEPIFRKVMTSFTCASLKNRGIHKASKLLDRYMADEAGTAYTLKIDIRKFYPNIDHSILKTLLRKKLKDKQLLVLLDKIIDSVPGGKGVPIGSYLSQYLANFYLTYFDHWLKEEMGVKYVIRYMDDIVILHHSKEHLHWLLRQMEEYLDANLKLQIKGNWQVFPTKTRGVDFVGYRHFYGYKLLRKTTCKRFKRKMRSIHKKVIKGVNINFNEWCSANSYKGWLMWCDSYRLCEKYLTPIQEALDNYYNTKIKGKAAEVI
jgi:retron-type reverse transcriptase